MSHDDSVIWYDQQLARGTTDLGAKNSKEHLLLVRGPAKYARSNSNSSLSTRTTTTGTQEYHIRVDTGVDTRVDIPDQIHTPSLINKLGRRPDSVGGSNVPRRRPMPDPDALRSPLATPSAGALISGTFAASYSIWNAMIIQFVATDAIIHKHTNHFISFFYLINSMCFFLLSWMQNN